MISEVGSAACHTTFDSKTQQPILFEKVETWARTEHRRARRGRLEQKKNETLQILCTYKYVYIYILIPYVWLEDEFLSHPFSVMLVSRRVFIDRVFYIGWLSRISETINIYSQMGSIQELA